MARGGGKARQGMNNWLYGVNPLREALRAGRRPEEVYLLKGKTLPEELHKLLKRYEIVPTQVPRSFFAAFPKGHQGVAGLFKTEKAGRSLSIDDLLSLPDKEPPFYLLIDGVTDPHNLGAILRSAEFLGIKGVVMEKHRVAGGSIVTKTSAGASEHIVTVRVPNIKHAIEKMKRQGVTVIGAEADGTHLPWEVDLTGGVALVVGSEGRGIRETVRRKCDLIVRIPQLGMVSSLNVSVAAGILLYEVRRQRALAL